MKKNINWKLNHFFKSACRDTLYILEGHVLNPLWLDRARRRRNRCAAKSNTAHYYLELYSDFIAKINPEGKSIDNSDIHEDRIFSIWFQGEENAPQSVKACFESMRRHNHQKLVVLDNKTLFDWITLPDYIMDKWRNGKIGAAHFSDICRVELLYQHGGIWMDATDFMTDRVPDEILDSDFFVFNSGDKAGSWYSFIQNCFIKSEKQNPLLGIWREAIFNYWKCEKKAFTYFIHQFLFRSCVEYNASAAALFGKMLSRSQDPTHVLWYQHKDDRYDEKKFHEYTDDTFFQKTDFKDKSALSPKPGSMAEFIFRSYK